MYYVIEKNPQKAHGPFNTGKEAAEWAALWIGYNPWVIVTPWDPNNDQTEAQ